MTSQETASILRLLPERVADEVILAVLDRLEIVAYDRLCGRGMNAKMFWEAVKVTREIFTLDD